MNGLSLGIEPKKGAIVENKILAVAGQACRQGPRCPRRDDIDAIIAAHAFANQHGLSVKADEGATHYVGGKNRTAVIQTVTDFGTAAFLIDDTDVQDRRAHVFLVGSSLQPSRVERLGMQDRAMAEVDQRLASARPPAWRTFRPTSLRSPTIGKQGSDVRARGDASRARHVHRGCAGNGQKNGGKK